MQHIIQIGTYGGSVAQRINTILKKNPGWELTAVYSIQVERTGGPENQVIAVFNPKDASVGDFSEVYPQT